jgi:hypothetical protein
MDKREHEMQDLQEAIPIYQPNGHEEQTPPLHLGHFAKP